VVQVLTAGRKGERAVEEGGHGLFTRRLLDGLRGLADPHGRGFITAGQLAAWIEPRVVRDSNGRMTPQYGKLDGEGDFVFVRAEPRRPPPASIALSATLEGIEVFLDEQRIGETAAGRPLVVDNLVAGTYRVKARKSGHRGWEG